MTRAKRKLIGKVDSDTGEVVPTDGRNKKPKTPASGDTDYKKMYEKLLKKHEAQETLRNCRKITLPFKALDTIVPGIACCAGFHINPCEIFI